MFSKIYLYISVLLLVSCEEVPDLGLDEGKIDVPLTTIITPSGTAFESSSITIEWVGNENARIFDYKLEFEDTSIPHSWAEWDTTSITSVDFFDLDEGAYTFYISGRYDADNIEVTKTLSFTINAISGPSLRIYPLSQFAQPGEKIDVYLYVEEVEDESAVTGLHVDIQINTDELEFDTSEYEQGELVTDFTGTTIWPSSPRYDNGSTTMSIDGVADGNGLYGTGSIAKFSLEILGTSGTFNIKILTEGLFLDEDGNSIEFRNPVNGSVTVE